MNLLHQNNIASAEYLLSLCREKHITLSTAESCTGGMIGATLTAIPGSSDIYLGGIISYANSVKENLLGVSGETLATVGAVSAETATAMAIGAKTATQATLAVSVTGIAGPGGATHDKPVGLVHFAIASPSSTHTEYRIFSGNREQVRLQTVQAALSLLTQAAQTL